jgi:hypothetical protein
MRVVLLVLILEAVIMAIMQLPLFVTIMRQWLAIIMHHVSGTIVFQLIMVIVAIIMIEGIIMIGDINLIKSIAIEGIGILAAIKVTTAGIVKEDTEVIIGSHIKY